VLLCSAPSRPVINDGDGGVRVGPGEDGGFTAIQAIGRPDALHPCHQAPQLIDPVHMDYVQPAHVR
jgi:hypothetical protein